MSLNLLKTVQENLGYPELQKIDPNTAEIVVDNSTPNEDKFSQSAIPAVLTGIYRYGQSDEGAAKILQDSEAVNWVNEIFSNKSDKVIEAISVYTKQSTEQKPVGNIASIATEAVKVIRENLPADAGIMDIKVLLSNQIHTILMYLPAALQIGVLLNDDTLDDATNKMEGPISSLMQKIGAAFSNPATAEDQEIKD